jgi:hypothetical protein
MFLHQKHDIININNQIRLTLSQFRALEPTYPELPLGYTERYYEPNVAHHITGVDRVMITDSKIWQDGDRYFERFDDFLRLYEIINQKEASIRATVQNELDKLKPYNERRKLEYPSIEQMVVAMWENLIEKQTKEASGVKELQKLRKQIKQKYPKE